jgi:hypothetical protein
MREPRVHPLRRSVAANASIIDDAGWRGLKRLIRRGCKADLPVDFAPPYERNNCARDEFTQGRD